MTQEITFSKSNAYTRLTAETASYMYDIVISNETGDVAYQVNSQNVDSLPVTSVTRVLMNAWRDMGQDLIDLAMMPVAEIKSQMYVDAFHYIREKMYAFNHPVMR